MRAGLLLMGAGLCVLLVLWVAADGTDGGEAWRAVDSLPDMVSMDLAASGPEGVVPGDALEPGRAAVAPLVGEETLVGVELLSRGRVLNGAGEPVVGAEVLAVPAALADSEPGTEAGEPWAYPAERGTPFLTDADGRFAVPWSGERAGPDDDTPRGLLIIRSESEGVLAWGRPDDLGDVQLAPLKTHDVEVRRGHQPAVGVDVTLRLELDERLPDPFLPTPGARENPDDPISLAVDLSGATDADGRLTLGAVPSARVSRVVARAPGFATATAPLASYQLGTHPTRLQLEAPRDVAGVVVDPAGRGVPDALVTLTGFAEEQFWGCGMVEFDETPEELIPEWVLDARREHSARHVRTDARGAYRFEGMDGRLARLTVAHPGFVPDQWEHRLLADGVLTLLHDGLLDVGLPPAEGWSVASTRLQAWSLDADGDIRTPLPVTVLAEGWRVHRSAGAAVRLRARAPDGYALDEVPAGSGSRRWVLRPEPGLSVCLAPVDADGRPVRLDALQLQREGWRDVDQERLEPDGEGLFHARARAPGTYRLSVAEEVDAATLKVPPWRLCKAQLELAEGGPSRMEVTAELQALLRVTRTGAEVAGSRQHVKIRRRGASGYQWFDLKSGAASFVLAPGHYDASLGDVVLASFELAPGEVRELELDLAPWPRITGRVHLAGRALEGVRVQGAVTDAAGQFELALSLLGETRIEIHDPGEPGLAGRRHMEIVELHPGADLHLDVDLAEGASVLRVPVVDARGVADAGRKVRLQLRGRRKWRTVSEGVTDSAGLLAFHGLAAGSYRAQLVASEDDDVSAASTEPVTLAAGAEAFTPALVREPCAVVSGHIRTAGGRRVWARMEALGPDGLERQAHPRESSYEFVDLEPGRWTFSVRGRDGLSLPLGAFTVRVGERRVEDFVIPD